MSVEAFATMIKNLDRWKSSLLAWLLRSEALDRLILWETKGQNLATPPKYLRKCVDQLILVAQNLSWSLDWLLKRTLITRFHFDPGRKRFYRRSLCNYPLQVVVQFRLATASSHWRMSLLIQLLFWPPIIKDPEGVQKGVYRGDCVND